MCDHRTRDAAVDIDIDIPQNARRRLASYLSHSLLLQCRLWSDAFQKFSSARANGGRSCLLHFVGLFVACFGRGDGTNRISWLPIPSSASYAEVVEFRLRCGLEGTSVSITNGGNNDRDGELEVFLPYDILPNDILEDIFLAIKETNEGMVFRNSRNTRLEEGREFAVLATHSESDAMMRHALQFGILFARNECDKDTLTDFGAISAFLCAKKATHPENATYGLWMMDVVDIISEFLGYVSSAVGCARFVSFVVREDVFTVA